MNRRLGKRERQDLVRRVHKGDVTYARKLTRSRTVIVLEYRGNETAFLYSNASKRIIRFLAPDVAQAAGW